MSALAALAGLASALTAVGIATRWRPLPQRFADLAVGGPSVSHRSRSTVDGVGVLVWFLVASAALVHPLLGSLAVFAGSAVGPIRCRNAERARDAALREQLPDLVDLFRSAVDAGLTVGQAVDAIAERLDGPCGDALGEVRRRVAFGERRAVALESIFALGEPARPLTAALIASERDGAPLARALEALSADARLSRRRGAEESARRLPVQLLFPLVLCILPAFGLLTVVPLLAGTLRSLTI